MQRHNQGNKPMVSLKNQEDTKWRMRKAKLYTRENNFNSSVGPY